MISGGSPRAHAYAAFLVALVLTGGALPLASSLAPEPTSRLPLPSAGCGPALLMLGGRPVLACVVHEPALGVLVSDLGESPPCELLDVDAVHRVRPWSRVRVNDWGDDCGVRYDELPGFVRLALGVPIAVNRASAADLDALPGIGPGLAVRVIEERTRLGGFTRLEQLDAVKGLSPKKLEKLRGLVSFD
jgi:competence protein ComEA